MTKLEGDDAEDEGIPGISAYDEAQYQEVLKIWRSGQKRGLERAAEMLMSFNGSGYSFEHIASCIRHIGIPGQSDAGS